MDHKILLGSIRNILKFKKDLKIMPSEDLIVEKLLEQRDLNLNNLKHLDFEMLMDPSDEEIKK